MSVGFNISGELPDSIRMMDAGYRRGVAKQKLQMLAPLMQYMSPEQRTTLLNSPAFQQTYQDAGIGELPPFQSPQPSEYDKEKLRAMRLRGDLEEEQIRKSKMPAAPKVLSPSEQMTQYKLNQRKKYGVYRGYVIRQGKAYGIWDKDGQLGIRIAGKRVPYTQHTGDIAFNEHNQPVGYLYKDQYGTKYRTQGGDITTKQPDPMDVIGKSVDRDIKYMKLQGITSPDDIMKYLRQRYKAYFIPYIVMKHLGWSAQTYWALATPQERQMVLSLKQQPDKHKGEKVPDYRGSYLFTQGSSNDVVSKALEDWLDKSSKAYGGIGGTP